MELFKNICGTITIPTLEEIFDDAVKNAAPKASNPLFFEELVAISRELLSGGPPEETSELLKELVEKGDISNVKFEPLRFTSLDIISLLTYQMRHNETMQKSIQDILHVDVDIDSCLRFPCEHGMVKQLAWHDGMKTREDSVRRFLDELTQICNKIEWQIRGDETHNKQWVKMTRTLFEKFIKMLNASKELCEYLAFNEALFGSGTDFGSELYCLSNYLESMKNAQKELRDAEYEFLRICNINPAIYPGKYSDDERWYREKVWDAESNYKSERRSYDWKKATLNRVVDFSLASEDEEKARHQEEIMNS